MRYGILGPLEVIGDAGPLRVAGAKLRALLVLLLLDANRVVSVDRLIEELWGGRPPPRATVTLRSYVSMLRRVVEPERAPGATSAVLAWQPPGYVLRVGPDDLDATRFERLARDGRAVLPSDPVAAETMLGEALALWRGDALADVAFEPFAQGEVARLGELRLATAEDQVEARLAAGRHAEVVPDLERLLATNPLRERLRSQLMLALYRSGRQADALRAYRDGRDLLVEELGIEPGPALRRLQEEILLQSPTLDWQPPGRARAAAAGSHGQAGATRGPTGGTRGNSDGKRGSSGDAHGQPGATGRGRSAPGHRLGQAPVAGQASAGGQAQPGRSRRPAAERHDGHAAAVWPAAGAPPEAAALVGRDAELLALTQALETATRGDGRLMLVGGDAGIGKTRLAEELAARAAARGVQVHRGACYELEGAPPFWPWLQVVRSVAEQLDDGELRQALGPGAAYVAQVAPELGDRVAATAPPALLDGEAARFRAYDAVARFLGRVAARRPLLLVLDDLHWADLPSLRLLAFVAGGLGRVPALLLATYRDGEVRAGHPLTETLARLAREPVAGRIVLGGLSEVEVAALLAGATGAAVPDRLSARLHRRTGGNPFLLGELARLLVVEGGLAEAASSEVPATVREVVGERLARLPGEAAEVLTVAALAPDVFEVDTLAVVTGLPGERVLELVEAALAARMVVEDPERRGGWRFAHDLVREAVYAGTSTVRRARLHAAYAAALEAVLAERAGEAAAELAHHFGQAAALAPPGRGDPDGVAAKGVGYARLAAEQASARLAYEDAAGHYARALAALDRDAQPQPRVRCELLLGLGDARRRSGEIGAARAALEPAFALARELGEATWMARAALGFNSGNLWASWLDLWQPDEPSVRLLDGARAALGAGDSSLKASVLAQLAVNFHTEDELSTLSEQSLGMARRLRDPRALADALTAQLITWPVAGSDERLTHADELVAMAEASGLPEQATLGRQYRVILLLQQGDAAGARAQLASFARAAEALQQPLFLVHLRWLRSMWALLSGRLGEAERLAGEAFERHRRGNPAGAVPAHTAQLAFIRHEQGRMAELEPQVRRWAADHPQTYLWQGALLLLLASSGRDAEAAALLAQLGADGVLGYGDNGPFPLTPDQATPVALAEAVALLGDGDAAGVLYQKLAPFAGRVVVTNTGLLFLGAVDHWLGRLATTMGRPGEARGHLETALVTHDRMGARALLARTRLHLAELLLDGGVAGERERAAALLEACLADAGPLGMAQVAARARDRQAPGGLGERFAPA